MTVNCHKINLEGKVILSTWKTTLTLKLTGYFATHVQARGGGGGEELQEATEKFHKTLEDY